MPTNDNRTYYIRNSVQGFKNLKVPQEFLNIRPLIKTPATEDSESIYYSENDNLTFYQAMTMYAKHSVAIFKEVENEKPVELGLLSDFEEIPEEATHVLYGLTNPTLQPEEIFALVNLSVSLGVPANQILIPYSSLQKYKNGELF